MKRIAVIGCGAAGMMAALAAAESSASATVFEKNEKPGKKIYRVKGVAMSRMPVMSRIFSDT